VVISQTCDIVNIVADRNFVVVAPIVVAENDKFLEEVAGAVTPPTAPLGCCFRRGQDVPSANVVTA